MTEEDVRTKMIGYRNHLRMTLCAMSKLCRCSTGLLELVEIGYPTHPNIAKRIGAIYNLTEEETELLMPVCRREHDPRYDPSCYDVDGDYFDIERKFHEKQKQKDEERNLIKEYCAYELEAQ